MPVQKTESRLPAGFTAADLGQSNSSGAIHLISYLSSPLAKLRIQNYCVFVTNAAAVATYNWTINDNGTVTNTSTTVGFFEFTPQNAGTLSVSVELKDGSAASIGTVALTQTVVALNTALEVLVDQQDNNIPSAGHPATSREAVNDLRMYADALLPPASDALFNKLILSTGYVATLLNNQVLRNSLSANYAAAINSTPSADMTEAMEKGIGICKVRPHVLAMFLNNPATSATYIPYVEMPQAPAAYKTAYESLKTTFNALSQDNKTDLFNLLRFPKSNYKMVKLIIEKLKDKYFSSTAIPSILADKTNTAKLIDQYFVGPFAGTGTASKIGTSVFDLMQHPVWNIAVLALSGSSPAAGSPTPVAFASPEQVPQLTFIAKPRQTDNGFIRNAYLYHDSYGLAPVYVDSFEDLVDKLSKQNTPITRLRVVSHFSFDPTGLTPSGMNMSFFTPVNPVQTGSNTPAFTVKEYFKYGINDDEGLAAIAGEYMRRENSHISDNDLMLPIDNKPNPTMSSIIKELLKLIRASNPNVLVPFSLQGVDSKPKAGSAIDNFIRYCCDYWYVSITAMKFAATQTPTTLITMASVGVNAVKAEIDKKITAAAPALLSAKATQQNIDDLKAAIIGISAASLPVPNPPMDTFIIMLDEELLKAHNTFRTNLATVKGRFTSSSVVDIRGCRVGLNPDFMTAVKEFFGTAGSLPIVTAPDWFQAFPTLGYSYIGTEAGIDNFFTKGTGNYTATDVQREYSNWSGRIGLTSHIAFWTQLANGDSFNFLAFKWKDIIPGLALPAIKTKDLGTLTFSAAIVRLGEIFNISASVPAAGTVQTFETNILPQLSSLKTVADNVAAMTAGTPQPGLDAANATIQQVKTALSQSLPAAPTPITLAYLNSSIQTLKTYVTQQLDVTPFLAAMKAKLASPNAGFRLLMYSGFPLPVQSATTEGSISLLMLDALKDEAAKTWTKTQWAGAFPGNFNSLTFNWSEASHIIPNGPGPNDDDLTDLGKVLQTAALAANHQAGELAINPTYEYQQHIKSTN